MATLKETATTYEGAKTKNIADLEAVSVEQEIYKEIRKDREDKDYRIYFILIENDEYRVPPSVLEQLQAMLKEKPLMKTFKVSKKGEGLSTTYTVIPLE